ncbi:MAG: group III truncated hemoglobin [Taibaiella sp.]|nr:group III truncated hemoglobin [Taibaiella sp.]
MKQDIDSVEDIKLLVSGFYKKVVADPVIAHFFTQVVHFSWEAHIPVMESFWGTILLHDHTYKGNPMPKHLEINRMARMEPKHFERWLALWTDTVNELFEGERATEAITRANTIAYIMQTKINATGAGITLAPGH